MTTFTPGQRVQAHPCTCAWMSGERYGTVYAVQHPQRIEPGDADTVVLVSMDSGRPARFPPELLLAVD